MPASYQNPNQDALVQSSLSAPQGTPINSSTLTQTPSTNYQTPGQTPIYPVAGLNPPVQTDPNADPSKLGAQGQQVQDFTTQLEGLNNDLTGQSAFRTQQETAQGIPDLQKTQTDLSSRLTALKNEALAIPLQLQQNATGRGVTAGGLQPHQDAALRENAIQALSVNSLLEASRGNLTTALDMVDRAVKQKFDPIQEKITAATKNLDLILKSPAYTNEEKQRAQAQKDVQDKKQQALDQAKQDHKDIYGLAVSAAQNGADSMTTQRIQQAKTPQEALDILAQSGYANDPVKQKQAEADLALTKAQTAKTYADAQQAGAATGTDPANIVAYAQQYASTGQIPTGLPKGTFGAVAQIAKEAPKAPGTLVDVNTGVKPHALSATTETGITSLYDIVNKLDDLKSDYGNTSTGFVSGVVSAVFPSNDNQRFNDMRSEIVDLLARARTGAVINASELAAYEKKLPSNFTGKFFTGASGTQLIDDLKRSITGKLDAVLSNNGTAIYGYSKVSVGDQKYTVGDVVTNAGGQKGRINPDGSITIIQ